jgi:tryptophan-rich sensory protein
MKCLPQDWIALAVILLVTFAAPAVGGYFTGKSVGTWYPTLAKPSWNPPAWVFGPVWTALFVLMAVAAWLVFRERAAHPVALAMGLYALQLVLNAAWSFIFFGLRNPAAGLAEIALLWLVIAATGAAFWTVKPLAGLLLIPYLAWVSFAAVLNFALWRLNRG